MRIWTRMAAAVLVAAMGAPWTARAGEHADPWPMAMQAYTFRNSTLFEAIDMTAEMGLKYIEAYPGQQLRPDSDTPFDHHIGPEDRQALKARLYDAGVRLVSYGVVGLGPGQVPFTEDEDYARTVFDFAADMGVDMMSAYPEPESLDLLEALVEEYGIPVAIHNSGPVSHYSHTEDTLAFLDGRHPGVGACVDTGIRIQVDEAPHESIRALGDRVLSVHLKDWEFGGDETVVGEGDMDLAETALALRDVGFDGPIMVELELDPEDPMPGAAQGLANWRAAVAEALE